MHTPTALHTSAAELVEAARTFKAAAVQPGSHDAAPASLAGLEEALQLLSAAWYQLAAEASPELAERRRGRGSTASSSTQVRELSREQEAHLIGTLHDVAAAFASCARACRQGRSTVTPIIARRVAAGQPSEQDVFR